MCERPDQPKSRPVAPDAGWSASLAAIYDRYACSLYRYALMLFVDHQDAQDAIHQVFVKLAIMDSSQMHAKSHRGYLLTAVRHECYSVMKKRRRRRDVDLSDPSFLQVDDGSMNNTDDDLRQNIEEAIR